MALGIDAIRALQEAIETDFAGIGDLDKFNRIADLLLALAANDWSTEGVDFPLFRGENNGHGLTEKLRDAVAAFPELNDLEPEDTDLVRYALCSSLYERLCAADPDQLSGEKLGQVKAVLDERYQTLYNAALPSWSSAMATSLGYLFSQSPVTVTLTIVAGVSDLFFWGAVAVRDLFERETLAHDVFQLGVSAAHGVEEVAIGLAEEGAGAGRTVFRAVASVTDFFMQRYVDGPRRNALPVDEVAAVPDDDQRHQHVMV